MAKKNHFPPRDEILAIASGGELSVKVTPNAGENSIAMPKKTGPKEAGPKDAGSPSILLVRVTATPEDGKANAAVLKLLSKALGFPKTSLVIVRGANSRTKVIAIPD